MFDFFAISNAPKAPQPKQAGASKKPAAGEGQTTQQATSNPGVVQQRSSPKSKMLGLVNDLRRQWSSLATGADLKDLAREADEAFAKLVNLDQFDVRDLEVLRKMSRATSALQKSIHQELTDHQQKTAEGKQAKAKESPQKPETAETRHAVKAESAKLRQEAKKALLQLKKHMEKLAQPNTRKSLQNTKVESELLKDGPKPERRDMEPEQKSAAVKQPLPATPKPEKGELKLHQETPQKKEPPKEQTSAKESKSQQQATRQESPQQQRGRVLGGRIGQQATQARQAPLPPRAESSPQNKQEQASKPGPKAEPPPAKKSSLPPRASTLPPPPARASAAKEPPSKLMAQNNAEVAQQKQESQGQQERGPQLLRRDRPSADRLMMRQDLSRRGFLGTRGQPAAQVPRQVPDAAQQVRSTAQQARAEQVRQAPLRGMATGSRPVTSNVPVYNPVLDGIYSQKAKGQKGGGGKIEPIKMSFTSSSRGTSHPLPFGSLMGSMRMPHMPIDEPEIQKRRQGGGGGSGGGAHGGEGGETPKATNDGKRQQRILGFRKLSRQSNFNLAMQRFNAGPPTQAKFAAASRHAGHSITSLLKKLYRDQEVEELDEDTAVNSLGLILKMGGEFTYAHSARVLDLALELADEVGITDRQTRRDIKFGAMLKDIGEMGLLLDKEPESKLEAMSEFMSGQNMLRAGLLHDIGKIQIPNEILYKPGRLTEEEYEIMKLHPVYGEQIVYPIRSLRHLCPTIRGHHERWDGAGYPDGLAGENIPLPARIIAVADVFDALAAERPYKAGMEVSRVRRILEEGKASHFDPDLVDAFLRIIDRRYPELALDN